jgi:hypothetical protein
MATRYTLLKSVRLTGRINPQGELEIVTKRDENEVVTALDIASDAPPTVRVEVHDFVQDTTACRVVWKFQPADPWLRDTGPYVWAQFDEFTDGEAYDTLTLVAQGEGAAAQQQTKRIVIKIEPVVDSPDKS